ncbi:hypothetical protein D3C74_228900 [compost metagenome]
MNQVVPLPLQPADELPQRPEVTGSERVTAKGQISALEPRMVHIRPAMIRGGVGMNRKPGIPEVAHKRKVERRQMGVDRCDIGCFSRHPSCASFGRARDAGSFRPDACS